MNYILQKEYTQRGKQECYSSVSNSYSSQNSPQKTFCCGRKNAGAHLQCGGCPER